MSSKGSVSGVKADAKHSLRVGVIGAGVMGSNHARVLAGLPDTTLVGIVDPMPAHRTRATELTGCHTFASLDELVAAGIDAVTIAAPTHLHHEIARATFMSWSKSRSRPRSRRGGRSSPPPVVPG